MWTANIDWAPLLKFLMILVINICSLVVVIHTYNIYHAPIGSIKLFKVFNGLHGLKQMHEDIPTTQERICNSEKEAWDLFSGVYPFSVIINGVAI